MKDACFRLPSGKHTSSSRRYIREWRKLTQAIERALDGRVYAFDPGVAIAMHDGSGYCTLPLWIAQKIAATPKGATP